MMKQKREMLLALILLLMQLKNFSMQKSASDSSFKTTKDLVNTTKLCYTAIYLKHITYNIGTLKAGTINIDNDFKNEGTCVTEFMTITKDCTLFDASSSYHFEIQNRLDIESSQTALHFNPQHTCINALYKKNVFLGSIECQIEDMGWLESYGRLTVSNDNKVSYIFENCSFTLLKKALSTGITKVTSFKEWLTYLQETFDCKPPEFNLWTTLALTIKEFIINAFRKIH